MCKVTNKFSRPKLENKEVNVLKKSFDSDFDDGLFFVCPNWLGVIVKWSTFCLESDVLMRSIPLRSLTLQVTSPLMTLTVINAGSFERAVT